jgi:hypothetical protein
VAIVVYILVAVLLALPVFVRLWRKFGPQKPAALQLEEQLR